MALVQNHFYINVSQNGKYVFHVDMVLYPRQFEVFELISSKFPKSEGYQVEMMEIKCSGHTICSNK